jgi:hypothetical protein
MAVKPRRKSKGGNLLQALNGKPVKQAEQVKQPFSGARIGALRPTGDADRPSNDTWRTQFQEPPKLNK